MRSSYKHIGKYVKQVNLRNKDLSVTNLQGIRINKVFMPSVANTYGTDLSKYKVVSRKQFAFNPMHVGRDEVLPISMLEDEGSVIVSPAYVVFEVKDENELLPEYLMMWCRRPEFDRNAWFTSDSSVRGGFSWKDFCEMELPIPSPEKQREIVKEYHTIVNRIKLNEQLNQKLEETAQAIYKQWFVDFEFPISAEHAAAIGRPELEGKPYKSSGGEMVYNEELDQEIPKGWETGSFTSVIQFGGGGTPSTGEPEYWGGGIPFFTGKDVVPSYYTLNTEKSITEQGVKNSSTKLYPKNTTFVVARGATTGVVALSAKQMAMNQSCYAIVGAESGKYFAHQLALILMSKMKKQAIGGAIFSALVTKDFDEQIVINPDLPIINNFEKFIGSIYHYSLTLLSVNHSLSNLLHLLLARMTVLPESDL